jgi:2-iminobutanoate/2-iminopropanoate deaminase
MSFRYIKGGEGIAPAVGAYSPAVIAGETCYLSGQIALRADGTLAAGDAASQTKVVMQNISAILAAADLSLKDVVLVQILLANIADFSAVNAAYAECLPDDHRPARVTYQAGALPLGAGVEIQTIAVRQGQ